VRAVFTPLAPTLSIFLARFFLKSANRMQLGCPYTMVVGWILVFAFIIREVWNALHVVKRANKKLNPDAD
jgi:hypothetical protein